MNDAIRTDETETETRLYLTRIDFLAMVRRAPRGAKFMLSIRNDAPTVNMDGKHDNGYFQMGLSSFLDVSRKEAMRLGDDMLSPTLESRGARIPVRLVERSAEHVCGKQYQFWFGA